MATNNDQLVKKKSYNITHSNEHTLGLCVYKTKVYGGKLYFQLKNIKFHIILDHYKYLTCVQKFGKARTDN